MADSSVCPMETKLLKAIKKFWESLEPEPPVGPKPEFETGETCYAMPEPKDYDFYDLDPVSKRKMTICNLFVNHQKSIPEIATLLEISRKLVIDTLIESKLIKDRRQKARPVTEDKRQK